VYPEGSFCVPSSRKSRGRFDFFRSLIFLLPFHVVFPLKYLFPPPASILIAWLPFSPFIRAPVPHTAKLILPSAHMIMSTGFPSQAASSPIPARENPTPFSSPSQWFFFFSQFASFRNKRYSMRNRIFPLTFKEDEVFHSPSYFEIYYRSCFPSFLF